MPSKKAGPVKECCSTESTRGKYDVEAVATVDERGQMVLPKAIRDKAGIRPGDKLAIVTLTRNGKVCCLHLFRSDDLADGVAGMLGTEQR